MKKGSGTARRNQQIARERVPGERVLTARKWRQCSEFGGPTHMPTSAGPAAFLHSWQKEARGMRQLIEWFVDAPDEIKRQIGEAILRHDRLPTRVLHEVEMRFPITVAEARWWTLAQTGSRPDGHGVAEHFIRALTARL